jgi:hypothetical protein
MELDPGRGKYSRISRCVEDSTLQSRDPKRVNGVLRPNIVDDEQHSAPLQHLRQLKFGIDDRSRASVARAEARQQVQLIRQDIGALADHHPVDPVRKTMPDAVVPSQCCGEDGLPDSALSV